VKYDISQIRVKLFQAQQSEESDLVGFNKVQSFTRIIRTSSDRVHQTTQKIAETGWEMLTYPPYSPDLAPSDVHLFEPLKESLGGIKYENDDAVKQHVLKFLHH